MSKNKLLFLKDLKDFSDLDYEKFGLKCGIEIHQQLDTGKLFCSCPCEIVSNETFDKLVERKLRFSLSEKGEVDKAALNEFKKGKFNVYKYNDKITCLVDLDEEPPKSINSKSLSVGVRVSQMFGINFFDRVQFMRKLIIDGSITSGFQRTAMLGFGGFLETSYGRIEINSINVEEDSCRTLERKSGHTVFSLDRQGIPLIEITTGPQIYSPKQAFETAKQLGNILRSFKETKRGLGTIRQDLNVSIIGGSRVEIKGAQNLKMIPQIIETEVKRQLVLKSIIDELKNSKNLNKENFSDFKIYDISKIFLKTQSKVLLDNLSEENSGVFGIKLNKFKGILGHEIIESYRFASEISDRNKLHFPQLKGLFHLDELPKYGILGDEVLNVIKELSLGKEDSFIMIAGNKDLIMSSLKFIFEIISSFFDGVPSEVRQVDPKGVLTKFLRPMPGSARMYPETDVPMIDLTKDYLDEQKSLIPELYDKKILRLSKKFNIGENKVEDILSKFSENDFDSLILESGFDVKTIYNTIFEIPKEIKKRENIDIFDLEINFYKKIFDVLKEDLISKESLYNLFLEIFKDNFLDFENILTFIEKKSLKKEKIDIGILKNNIKTIIDNNPNAPFGALMGIVMKEFSGKVEGKLLSSILKDLLK